MPSITGHRSTVALFSGITHPMCSTLSNYLSTLHRFTTCRTIRLLSELSVDTDRDEQRMAAFDHPIGSSSVVGGITPDNQIWVPVRWSYFWSGSSGVFCQAFLAWGQPNPFCSGLWSCDNSRVQAIELCQKWHKNWLRFCSFFLSFFKKLIDHFVDSLIRYDLIDITRQYLQLGFDMVYQKLVASYKQRNQTEFDNSSKLLLEILDDIDAILSTNDNFLLGLWIDSARALTNDHNVFEFHSM